MLSVINVSFEHTTNDKKIINKELEKMFTLKTINNTIQYNTIQYKNEYYYSGINPIEFLGHNEYYELIGY